MNYASAPEVIKVLTEGFGYPQLLSIGQFFTKANDLPLPLFLPIPGALTASLITWSLLEVSHCKKNFKLIQFCQCHTASARCCWEPSVPLRVSGPL